MEDFFNIPFLKPFKLATTNLEVTRQTPTDSHTGFIRGNLFEELYEPYIEAEPFRLTPQNEREALLNKIQEYNFALIDLTLYLDVHPDDEEKIRLYNEYLNQMRTTTSEYERRYGPLTLNSDILNTHPWSWIMPPWPWEVM